jgi:hypothetical protein
MGSTSSRVPAGSCFRPLLRFDCANSAFFKSQAIPVCPTVSMSHCFSRQFLVLNDLYFGISLSNFNKNVPLYPAPKASGFYGQLDKALNSKPKYIMGSLSEIFVILKGSYPSCSRG